MEAVIGSSGQGIDWISSWDSAQMVTRIGARIVAVIK